LRGSCGKRSTRFRSFRTSEELDVAIRLRADGGGNWHTLDLYETSGANRVPLFNKTGSTVQLEVGMSWTRFNNGLTLCLLTTHAREEVIRGRREEENQAPGPTDQRTPR
jgi:hypothetical protein